MSRWEPWTQKRDQIDRVSFIDFSWNTLKPPTFPVDPDEGSVADWEEHQRRMATWEKTKAFRMGGEARYTEVQACWRHSLGYWHPLGPETDWYSTFQMLTEDDPGPDVRPVRITLIAIWPTDDQGRLQKEHLGYVEIRPWIIQHTWWWGRDFQHWSLAEHDYTFRCMSHGPTLWIEASPCRDNLTKMIFESDKALAKAIQRKIVAEVSAWNLFDQASLVQHLSAEDLKAQVALENAAEEHYRKKTKTS